MNIDKQYADYLAGIQKGMECLTKTGVVKGLNISWVCEREIVLNQDLICGCAVPLVEHYRGDYPKWLRDEERRNLKAISDCLTEEAKRVLRVVVPCARVRRSVRKKVCVTGDEPLVRTSGDLALNGF